MHSDSSEYPGTNTGGLMEKVTMIITDNGQKYYELIYTIFSLNNGYKEGVISIPFMPYATSEIYYLYFIKSSL